MKKFLLFVSTLLLLPLITSCVDKKLEFVGTSENWDVVYEVTIHAEDSESNGLLVKYIGEDPPPQEIDYQLSSGEDGENTIASGNRISLIRSGVAEVANSSCSGCSITFDFQKFNATIEWNGNSESMVLSNE
ncbi:hypothetical protein GH741_11350 [Aquibacillus halophilus]|uniref:Lipoprotein n=1 Tax=Aquibacillus halophilus TaxID=930132 RepID=A0A6A8DFH4_9BACI|nr:hypothetical protein [Aquibacillus halophilus]MRH43276.1 hypothetical protein [Aquibacillus halophilus]